MEAISSGANDERLLTRFDSLQIDDERLSLTSEHNYDHQPTWPAWPGSSWRVGEKKEAWTLDHFDIGKQLGKGQLGSVFLAREKSTKSIVALKLMKEAKLYKANMEYRLKRQVEVQPHLNHPNILRLYGFFLDPRISRACLILELASNGTLRDLLQTDGQLDEPRAAIFMAQLFDGMIYLHSKRIIHRNIKPENLLLNDLWRVQISGFGWIVHAPYEHENLSGVKDYMPPEVVGDLPHDERVDHWMLGVLTHELLVGEPPFRSATQVGTRRRFLSADVPVPSHISSGAEDLIQSLLQIVPERRIPLKDALLHPWIREHTGSLEQDLPDKLLSLLPFYCSNTTD